MQKQKRLKYAFAILIAIIFISNIYNTIRISKINRISKKNEIAIKEENINAYSLNEYVNNLNSMISNNLNKTRLSIGLNSSEYPIKNIYENNLNENEVTKSYEDSALSNAVQILLEVEEKNNKSRILGNFVNDEKFLEFLNKSNSSLLKINDLKTDIYYKNINYISLYVNENKKIQIKSLDKIIEIENILTKEILDFLADACEKAIITSNKITKMEEKLAGLTDKILSPSENILSVFNGKKIIVSNIYNSNLIYADIKNSNGDVYFSISGNDNRYYSFDTFVNELRKNISNMDIRKEDEIKLNNIKSDFESQIKENEFQDYLKTLSLFIETKPREDSEYFYYDLKNNFGKSIGSFSLLKDVGKFYLVDRDGVPVTSIDVLTSNNTINNKIPIVNDIYSNKESLSFILLGNHEKNTDTMILVHIDKKRNKAFFIGIPRDLYWKGRKINDFFQHFGVEQLEKELTKITGLEITNHIIVDMYAFIDIVNIFGGLEVTLTEDLVDPTYKTRENGIWKTLNYKKGTYNFNGVEALRIVRSRHGSNDFERSKRQQIVLEAFYKKIKEFRLTDVDKLYKIIQTVFEYVDTDFSIKDMISLYNNYNNVEIAGQFVLSFDNVLYDTYSNIYMLDKEIDPDSQIDKGAWILLPKDNNWNNIKWYIRQIITGEIK